MFSIVVARDKNKGIAKNQKIPWNIAEDLKWFYSLTKNFTIIYGRKTYESIGRLLPNRENIIISRRLAGIDNAKVFQSLDQCVEYCSELYKSNGKTIFIVGGVEIYKWFIDSNLISEQYITEISHDYNCDLHYLDWITSYVETEVSIGDQFRIVKRTSQSVGEIQQLNLMRSLLTGNISLDRTSTGTFSLFGKQLEFSLRGGVFPLMTTRKMFLRGIFEELMFYLRGQTNNEILVKKNVNVWTANTTREFLDSRNLHHLPVGDMGHSYGFSFRHFGGKYINCQSNYTGVGFDQLEWCISEIKTNPYSRRLRISLWEPNAMHMAALPPCLEQYQFYVRDGFLTCMMTQRSSDYAVAGGWNVATGALLTIMLASVTGLQPDRLIWNIGDVHLYKNNIPGVLEQLARSPKIYPILRLVNQPACITDFEFSNLQLINYWPDPSIAFQMNV